MAVTLIFEVAGIGKAEYDAVNARLNLDPDTGSGDWPAGLLSHTAGISDDGAFMVIEVWESREAQGRFMQERLGPAIAQAGLPVQPKLTWVDLFAYHTPGKVPA